VERQILFRDYQEQTAQDHKDLQDFARASFDHLVYDAVTKTRRYSGFSTIKSAQAELQVQPGRFYATDGAIYNRATTLVQSVLSYLPAAAKRVISLTAYGVENETDVEERDFLVDVATGRTEPDAVSTTRSRDAILTIVSGAESADPQPPAIPVSSVEIARVLLDTTQVVSVTMMTENQVTSTEDLDIRAAVLEAFKRLIEPRVASLASDLAALANKINDHGDKIDIIHIMQDLAEVKEKVHLPATYSDYGASYFIWADPDVSDLTDSLHLGFDAKVEEGVRFPDAAANEFEVTLFSQLDQNASLQGGFLLPRYDHRLKISTGSYAADLGMAQYGYQTYGLVEKKLHKERIRYGGTYMRCVNGAVMWSGGDATTNAWWLDDFTSEQYNTTTTFDGHWYRTDYYWKDSWSVPYWELETIQHNINGAQIAQSFLVANDMWATRLGFYVTSKAAAENIYVSLVEVTTGVPDISKAILHQVYPAANIMAGWNRIDIPPTFLSKGGRYAVVLTSAANHRVGMAAGGSYLDGTFFYSMDGAYYLGDFTKELMIEVWCAQFAASQVTIEFAPITLDGGFRNVDLQARMMVPASTDLVLEVRPNGSGEWLQLTQDNISALSNAPPLAQFRGRFIGTPDIAPGIGLAGSRCKVTRPKTVFTHVWKNVTLAAPSTHVSVKLVLERFDATPHTCNVTLRVGSAWVNPTTVTTQLVDVAAMRYERVCTFNLAAATNTFSIRAIGTTNSPANLFHIAEELYWSS